MYPTLKILKILHKRGVQITAAQTHGKGTLDIINKNPINELARTQKLQFPLYDAA